MDRDRLQQVHQTDLTESRVNEDFVDWLRNKGPTWLLVVLLAIVAFLAVNRWRRLGEEKRAEADMALREASLPSTLEEVAETYPDLFGIPQMALLRAGDQLIGAVQANQKLGAAAAIAEDPLAVPETLSETERAEYLTRAEGHYQAVLASLETAEESELAEALHAVRALMGLAAAAESRGDTETANRWCEQAAERAEPFFPGLAAQARERVEDPVEGELRPMPTVGELSQVELLRIPETKTPAQIDPALDPLIYPDEATDQ